MKGRNKTIASIVLIIGVLIIPLIYSGLYLASVWDAYGRMDALPVAVVRVWRLETYTMRSSKFRKISPKILLLHPQRTRVLQPLPIPVMKSGTTLLLRF